LKKEMEERLLHIFYDSDLINEMNSERYEMTNTGQIKFSHPRGTHDDRLWALALAVNAVTYTGDRVSSSGCSWS